jgi:hypothetical protein
MLQPVQYHSTSQDGQYEEHEITELDDGDEYFEQQWNPTRQVLEKTA